MYEMTMGGHIQVITNFPSIDEIYDTLTLLLVNFIDCLLHYIITCMAVQIAFHMRKHKMAKNC